jgi:hypothetical protein
LTELEQAWVVRSLHREDRLTQAEIARRMGRHKSWVCRRLMLAESLDAAVQADVRLGLLSPSAAVAVAALPRCNQHAAADVIVRLGLTLRQTIALVTELLECADNAARSVLLERRREGPLPRGSTRRPPRSEADGILSDVSTVLRVGARLEARLLARPLGAHGPEATELCVAALVSLSGVLTALARTIGSVTGARQAA